MIKSPLSFFDKERIIIAILKSQNNRTWTSIFMHVCSLHNAMEKVTKKTRCQTRNILTSQPFGLLKLGGTAPSRWHAVRETWGGSQKLEQSGVRKAKGKEKKAPRALILKLKTPWPLSWKRLRAPVAFDHWPRWAIWHRGNQAFGYEKDES